MNDKPFALPDAQQEPAAAFWLSGPNHICVPTIDKVEARLRTNGVTIPYDPALTPSEFEELKLFEQHRNTQLTKLPVTVRVAETSMFLHLQNLPFGTIYNIDTRDGRLTQVNIRNINEQLDERRELLPNVVLKGAELARMFENETPGLLHRHALDYLLFNRTDVSPPRQARIWMALDVAISAALAAAWWFKWARGAGVSFRWRPSEYADENNLAFKVLYGDTVNASGSGSGTERETPATFKGTPRHPAYPSGHSTYSKAASRVLQHFFREKEISRELDLLADNIGEARIWGGVHWRSDHTFGQALGNAVADEIIAQLQADCIPPMDPPDQGPITLARFEVIRERESARRATVCDVDQDVIDPERASARFTAPL